MITRLSIGEFSKATSIPPKTLRFYHEKGLLIPAVIDRESGYRFYDQHCFERAKIITALKRLDFSLGEIAEILEQADDDQDILEHLESQKKRIRQEVERNRTIIKQIDQIIVMEKESKKLSEELSNAVQEKETDSLLVAGIRIKARYSDCGKVFGTLGRRIGRQISGKAMCLYYDGEYKEEDADFEPCFPISKAIDAEGISVHEIPSTRCLSLIHEGSYDELGQSYAKLFDAARQRELTVQLPTREIYVKGPGMVFRGKPENYITEIQVPVS